MIHYRSRSGLSTCFAKQKHTRLSPTRSSIALHSFVFTDAIAIRSSPSLQDGNTLVYLLLGHLSLHILLGSRTLLLFALCSLHALFKTETLVHMVFRLLIYHPTFFYGSQIFYHRRSSRSAIHSLFKTVFQTRARLCSGLDPSITLHSFRVYTNTFFQDVLGLLDSSIDLHILLGFIRRPPFETTSN